MRKIRRATANIYTEGAREMYRALQSVSLLRSEEYQDREDDDYLNDELDEGWREWSEWPEMGDLPDFGASPDDVQQIQDDLPPDAPADPTIW